MRVLKTHLALIAIPVVVLFPAAACHRGCPAAASHWRRFRPAR
jgi:hypothetical protein